MSCAHASAVGASRAAEWRYLSEGKLNLVATYVGVAAQAQAGTAAAAEEDDDAPSARHCLLAGHVIKVSKATLRRAAEVDEESDGSHAESEAAAASSEHDLSHRLHVARRYVERVMQPMFAATRRRGVATADTPSDASADTSSTPAWFDTGRVAWIDSAVLTTLLERDRHLRPPHRLAQFEHFQLRRRRRIPVLLFEDYTAGSHLHMRAIPRAISSPPSASSCPSPLPLSPPTMCIELKPKWGYLPSRDSPALPLPALTPIKFDTCRYCMHQHLKHAHGEVASVSGFCPLDLYACTPARVYRAVSHLLATPQNNLRVFVRESGGAAACKEADGDTATTSAPTVQMIDLEDTAHLYRLVQLLCPGATTACHSSRQDSSALLQSFLTTFLCRTPAFRTLFTRLATLQSRLDHLDIERLHTLVTRLRDVAPEALTDAKLWPGVETEDGSTAWMARLMQMLGHRTETDASESSPEPLSAPPVPESDDATSGVFVYAHDDAEASDEVDDVTPLCAHHARMQQTRVMASDDSFSTIPDLPAAAPLDDALPACASAAACPHRYAGRCWCYVVDAVRSFLIATTWKDVSIMCTLQVASSTSEPATGSANAPLTKPTTRVTYALRLIDLERKSSAKLPEYYRLDQEIVQHYAQLARP